jgi:hypothetical protein
MPLKSILDTISLQTHETRQDSAVDANDIGPKFDDADGCDLMRVVIHMIQTEPDFRFKMTIGRCFVLAEHLKCFQEIQLTK